MAKKVLQVIKLQIPGGQANPAPPVGPALGQHGVNIMEFCKAFNAQTADQNGRITPVEITVYEDRSFTFITKTPPAAVLIKEALGLEKGSAEPKQAKAKPNGHGPTNGRASSSKTRPVWRWSDQGFLDGLLSDASELASELGLSLMYQLAPIATPAAKGGTHDA